MEYLKSLFTKKAVPVCHQHPGRIIKVCCSHSCKRQRMICASQQCFEGHRGHQIISYAEFSENLLKAEQQMEFLQKIQHAIQDYEQKMQNHLKNLFKQSKKSLFDMIEKKFLNKQFVEARKRYRNKDDYIPYLKNLEMTTASHLYETISRVIKQRQRNINKIIKHEDIGLDISILPVQNIRQIITYSKIDNIKSLLPFKCNLVLKFQASKNKFRIQQLHMVQGIKAPVLIVAESYKNKIFGGFSPAMFPKNDQYIQDRKGRSFLFSLDERLILPIKDQYRRYSIRGGNFIWFGRGDLVISDECNKGNISWAQTGRAYKAPVSVAGRQNEFMGGAWYFRILQFELYEVQIISQQFGQGRFNFE